MAFWKISRCRVSMEVTGITPLENLFQFVLLAPCSQLPPPLQGLVSPCPAALEKCWSQLLIKALTIPHWSSGARAWNRPASVSPGDKQAVLRHLAAHSSRRRLSHIGSSRFLLCFLICANLSPALRAGNGEVTQQMKWSPHPQKKKKKTKGRKP